MNTAAKIAVSIVAVVVVFVVWILWASNFWTDIWWALRASAFVTLPLIGLAILILILVGLCAAAENSGSFVVVCGASVIVGICAVVGFLFWVTSIHSYKMDREYAASIHQVDTTVPQFEQRAPFSVASSQVRSNTSVEGADLSDTTTSYLPQHNVFTTLVNGRSGLGNYAAVVSQSIPLQGRGAAITCSFSPDATRIDGGWFAHNLARLVSDHVRWLTYDSADVYAYCDGTTPMVVVPLKSQVGLWVTTWRPAGVALYNGHTDALTVVQDPKALVAIPGPTYPLSLAERQRDSTDSLGSFGDYLFNRAGYQTTDANGDPDTNSGNSAEFVLGTVGTKKVPSVVDYVTPLTDQGSSTAVSHESVLSAQQTQPGSLAAMTIHKLVPTGVSTAAIESRIRSDYQDIPNWTALSVAEIAPYSSNEWVATLTITGGQNIQYRIRGTWDLSTFPGQPGGGKAATCLYDGDSDQPVRCGSAALTNGNGIGTAFGGGGSSSPSTPAAPKGTPTLNLKGMTPQQLAALLNQIAAALAAQKAAH